MQGTKAPPINAESRGSIPARQAANVLNSNGVQSQNIPKFPTCQVFLDHYDVYELANRFTIPELRREVNRAEISGRVCDIWGEPSGYWWDFAATCRDAIIALQGRQSKLPKQPAPKGFVDVEAVKAANDIVSIASKYTQLKKAGKNFSGCCPFHSENHPSFVVYPDTQTWHCFGACSTGGDIFSLIMKVEGVDFKGAAAYLGGQ